MASKELVYLSDVRRALLRFEPEAVYTLEGLRRVDAVVVEDKKLLEAIRILVKQYDHSKQSEYVHNPIAHALYHTWRQVDEKE